MTTSTEPPPQFRRRGRGGPIGTLLAVIGVVVVIGAIWLGYAASNARRPSEPAILEASGPSVVAGQAPPGPRARPAGQSDQPPT